MAIQNTSEQLSTALPEPFASYIGFDPNGIPRPLYRLDPLDRVIFVPNPSASLKANGWPDGSQFADFETHYDPDGAYEGRATRHSFLKYVRHLFSVPTDIYEALGEKSILRCYPNGSLQRSDVIFYPIVGSGESDGEILRVLEAIMNAAPENKHVEDAVRVLQLKGVCRIPDLTHFTRRYHKAERPANDGDPIVRIVQAGWLRDGRVLVKSVVEVGENDG